jgi:digeranylgeranylglycerophospholipid reductase
MSLFMLNRFPWAPKEGYPLDIQYISFPGGYRTYSSIEAISVDRTVFDQSLCEMAQNEGAQLNINSSVKKLNKTREGIEATTNHGTTSAKVVIAADGPSSRMMRQMKLSPPEELVQGIEYRIRDLDVEGLQFYFDYTIAPHGYGWIFDKGEGIANVGICLQGAMNPRARLDQFMRVHNIKGEIEQVIAGIIPSSGPVKHCSTDHFMVVGDAGGFTNPMFFGGIGIAMLTGMMAGETAVEALEEDNFSADKLISYSQKVKELPIASPNLIIAHDLFYHQCNNEDLSNIGILTDNQDITHLSWTIGVDFQRYLKLWKGFDCRGIGDSKLIKQVET